MKDNLPEDHYFYEIIVQTGPMLSHGTESKVQFIVTGEENETQIRTLSDPTKKFFKKGSLDTFLMSVDEYAYCMRFHQINHTFLDHSDLFSISVYGMITVVFEKCNRGI